jgi:hypothetical protein
VWCVVLAELFFFEVLVLPELDLYDPSRRCDLMGQVRAGGRRLSKKKKYNQLKTSIALENFVVSI